jgi:hypothetical protein
MREKKGKLFIGSRQTPGFGAGNLGVGYSEVQLKKL